MQNLTVGLLKRIAAAILEAMRDGRKDIPDHYNYLTKTHDGRILRSSTIYIKDEDGRVTGVFAINYDMTELMMTQSVINAIVQNNPGGEPERIPTNVNELLDDLLEQSVQLIGRPVAMMNKDDKVKAIRFLNDAGAMLITKSGDKIAKYFGISKYTLYSYLDIPKQKAGAVPALSISIFHLLPHEVGGCLAYLQLGITYHIPRLPAYHHYRAYCIAGAEYRHYHFCSVFFRILAVYYALHLTLPLVYHQLFPLLHAAFHVLMYGPLHKLLFTAAGYRYYGILIAYKRGAVEGLMQRFRVFSGKIPQLAYGRVFF